MSQKLKKITSLAGISFAAAILTLGLSQLRFFQLLSLKAQDVNFVLRGSRSVSNVVLIGIDDETLNRFPEPSLFWQKYYGDAITAAADGGAKVFVLDIAFSIPVEKYVADNDGYLLGAFNAALPRMPVICAYVPEAMGGQAKTDFAVPLNIAAGAMGLAGYANLTDDPDAFVRRQELIEAPDAGANRPLARSMALLAAEKYLGKEAALHGQDLYLGDRRIPAIDREIVINFAGPPGTVPMVPLDKFLDAAQRHDTAAIRNWVQGKIVLLGPDSYDQADRHNTPFYTMFAGSKYTTAGVEVHANTLNTLLTGDFLRPVSQLTRVIGLLVAAGVGASIAGLFLATQTALWALMALLGSLAVTHVLFLNGWLLSSSEVATAFSIALLGGVIYRFATAERKSSFFRGAVALFVGKQVATSLDASQTISLQGKRQTVTILFTDIRGFTAFCESKDPAEVVDLLNAYMQTMVSIIVKHHGHVNKFIGDGILAIFSDEDEGAKPGDHAARAVICATAMVEAQSGNFRTGAGIHSGEVVIGNVGSSDKMEFTVLGDTVNIAARLESLNKEQKTKLLLSGTTREMSGGQIDTTYIGEVPVRGKTEPMKLYTVTKLIAEERSFE